MGAMSAEPGQPAPDRGGQPVERPREPRRNLAGIGFTLAGAWLAVTSYQMDAGLVLRLVLVLVGLAVVGYGVAQLVGRRRR